MPLKSKPPLHPPSKKAKPRPQFRKEGHSKSVKCPQIPLKHVLKVDVAEALRKTRSSLEKLVHVGENFMHHVETKMKKSQVITESHPVNAEYQSWRNQMMSAMIEARKTLSL